MSLIASGEARENALNGDSCKVSSGEVEEDEGSLAKGRNTPTKAPKKRLDVKLALEATVLIVILVVVWTLLSLPIVFYHLPVEDDGSLSISVGNTSNVECFPYPTTTSGSDGVCQTELTDILLSLNCDTGETPLVLRDAESTAGQLLPLLNFLNPSPACREAVVPFLCVFLFGVCDSSGVSIQPTSTQCEHIRDVLCPDEWTQAAEFVDLPTCDSFSAGQTSCPVSSGSGFNGTIEPEDNSQISTTPEPLNCREDFFREEEGGPCVPSCFTWKEYSLAEVIVTDLFIGLSALIGFISGLAIVIISCIRFKQMFTFPFVIMVLLTLDIVIIVFFVIISYFDRPSLYCTSMNLLDSLLESTPFCVITAIVFMYLVLQTALWWLFHMTIFFWKIHFPFHARSFELSNNMTCIKILTFTVCMLVPLVSVITPMATFATDLTSDPLKQKKNITFLSGGLGFRIIRFPPVLCLGGNDDAVYYSTLLPINIVVFIGITELIFIFYAIHKHHGLFKSKKSKFLSTAEKKVLITLCYYLITAVVSLASYTVSLRNVIPFATHLRSYFVCEQPGHNPDAPCDRSTFRQLAYPELTTIGFVLLALIPLVNLIYALNVTEVKKACRMCCRTRGKYKIPSGTGSSKSSQMALRATNEHQE